MTKILAMESVGTPLDIGLMGAGLQNPLYREPIAAAVDWAVLSRVTGAHEKEIGHEDGSRRGKAKKYGDMLLMLATAIGAQKAGLAVAEHAGAGRELSDGVMLGSKYTTMLGISGANTLKNRV